MFMIKIVVLDTGMKNNKRINTRRMNNIIDYKIIEDLLAKIRLKIDNSFQIRG